MAYVAQNSVSEWTLHELIHLYYTLTFFPLTLCPEPLGLLSQREWQTDTTSTVSWSIFSRSTSAQDTPTPASGNGWSTSTETLTAPTWDILTCWTTSPSLRMRAKRVSASTWWRRCFSHADHQQTNLTMPRSHWSELKMGFFYRIFFDGHSTWFSSRRIQCYAPLKFLKLELLLQPFMTLPTLNGLSTDTT